MNILILSEEEPTDEETHSSDFNTDRRSEDFVCSEFLSASSGSRDSESQFRCEKFFRRSGISQAEEEVCVRCHVGLIMTH